MKFAKTFIGFFSQATRDYYGLLFSSFLKHRSKYILGGLAVVFINAFEMVPPILFKYLLESKKQKDLFASVLTIASVLFLGYCLVALFRFAWRYYFMITSREIERDLRSRAYDCILDGRYSDISRLKVGETISLLSQDSSDFRMFMGPGLLILVDVLSYVVYIPLTLYWVLGPVFLLLMIPMLTIPFFMYYYEVRMGRFHTVISEELAHISDHVYEDTLGQKIFKVLGLISIRKSKFRYLVTDLYGMRMQVARWDTYLDSFLKSVIFCAYTILLYLSFTALKNLSPTFSTFRVLGSIVLTLQILDKMIWPLIAVSYLASLYEKSRAAIRRLQPLLNLTPNFNGRIKLLDRIHRIELINFSFKYPQGMNCVLSHINMTIEAGQKIGVVGPVGSGKSTLMKVLATLYNPQEVYPNSMYLINGHDYRDIEVEGLRRQISYIPQETVIFNTSVLRNVAPQKSADAKRVLQSLTQAHLIDEILELPEKLQTPIGEKGINLSGGQKQRVSIARSFYSGASLYLWDDSISALDIQTERNVVKAIYELNPDSLLLLCTHRPSALVDFDQIYVMDKGEIVESGTFKELMSRRSAFANLYEYEQKTSDTAGVQEERI